MKSVKFVMGIITVFAMTCNAAWHWDGDGDGVGDFEDPASWAESSVPGVGDFLVVKNFASSLKNWVVDFNSNVTNLKVELVATTNGYSTAFNLNSYTWELTQDIHMYAGAGGKLIFTNGMIKTPLFDFTCRKSVGGSALTSQSTNLVLELKDMGCETAIAKFASTRAIMEGGTLIVTNEVYIGAANFGMGTVILDEDAQFTAANKCYIGSDSGATGELINVNGQIEHPLASDGFYVGYNGYGSMAVQGGTIDMHRAPIFGANSTGVGVLTVSGGVNTFGNISGNHLLLGNYGKGTAFASGGTNYAFGVSLGNNSSGYGEMTVTGGLWDLTSYSYIGRSGEGKLTVDGGVFDSGGTFCIGRVNGGKGDVTVSGGTMIVSGELRLGGDSGSIGKLTLAGDGTLKTGYIRELSSGASSEFVCDGGMLQVSSHTGSFIQPLDHLYLSANGMTLDTLGRTASIETELENATGESGSFTKTGVGTAIFAAGRSATGPVSVLQGTLVASNDVAVTAADTVSRIDGTLTLTSDKRLIMGSGAAISGVGTVTRITLQDNAVIARDKADSATTPLNISDGIANDRVTIALTGYTLNDLKTALPLISAPTAFIDLSKVSVTLDGQSQAFLTVKYAEVDGKQVLSVKYSAGTVILVR